LARPKEFYLIPLTSIEGARILRKLDTAVAPIPCRAARRRGPHLSAELFYVPPEIILNPAMERQARLLQGGDLGAHSKATALSGIGADFQLPCLTPALSRFDPARQLIGS